MSNIIEAICNLNSYMTYNLSEVKGLVSNRIQAQGDALEKFVKIAFLGEMKELESLTKEELDVLTDANFDWLGQKNNIPDAILKDSDAIEVKKNESPTSMLALNSSYPKSYLSDEDVSKKCIEKTGKFGSKKLIYAVGTVKPNSSELKSLWFVYGDCMAADRSLYKNLFQNVKDAVTKVGIDKGIRMTKDSKEPGRFLEIDELNRTNMRIRNMFELESPVVAFEEIVTYDKAAHFQCNFLCLKEQFQSFPEESVSRLKKLNIEINEVKIKDPNDARGELDAIHIHFKKNLKREE
jgi:hypothetical protein